MDVAGNLNFKGIGKLIRPSLAATDFPPDPDHGELVLKDRKLYICVDIVDGLPYWVNLVNELSMFRYDQDVPAMEWTIEHGLNTNIVLVQVYDAAGNQVYPDNINCSEIDRVTVTFNQPMTGIVAITSGDVLGLPRANSAYTNTYASSDVWVVDHNLGYNPNITVVVDGYVVQPASIVHNSVMRATITFTSAHAGSVRCV